VPDLGLNIGEPEKAAGFYTPLAADERQVNLALRTAGDPRTLAGPLRLSLNDLNRGLTLERIALLEDVNREDRVFFANAGGVLVALGLVTLVLALAGVYAMTSLVVTRRTREIGIRVALGASPAEVVKTTLRRAAIQVGLGTALGYGLGLLASGARELLAFRIGDGGPWILPAVTALFAIAGVAATWAPVRRALRIRPIEALRAQ
jgi:ABC-type antimicrobial peptide transport system permease subunit